MIYEKEILILKIVILGAGEVGYHIANRLSDERKEVVVIDKDEQALKRIGDAVDAQIVKGSGSSPSVLEEAGLEDASLFLAVTDTDQINLVACLFADFISPKTKKLARLRDADYTNYENKLRLETPHIDTIINPDIEAVKTIERMIHVPEAVDVEEFADGKIKLIGIRMAESSPLNGIRLIDLPKMSGNNRILITAVIREEKLIIPQGNDRLMAGDLIYFVCEQDRLHDALSMFGKYARTIRNVMVVGGGRIGFRVANLLESKSIHTKIIEKDPACCDMLAAQLNRSIVLQGDGSDQSLLKEENIQDMDLVITVTGDEETNILASLLSKRMGAKQTITRISKFSYFPLVEAIGIENIVSPRLSAVNTILQHIRKGNVLSAISIKGEQAEVMEAVATESSHFIGKPLYDLSFPKGSLVVGLKRGNDVIIPSGSTVIEPNDQITIFASRNVVAKIEKILTVKLKFFG